MFAAALSLALLASSAFAAPIRARAAQGSYVPETYREDILEPYFTYHSRYMALDCLSQHDTPFFDDCCHPLMINQTLASRPAKCTPSAPASSSAVIAESTISVDECGEETETSAPATSTTVTQATTTSSVVVTTSAVPTTSVARPAETTTTVAPPKTTTTKTSSSAQPTHTSGGGGGAPNTGGFATYFLQGGVPGACGKVHGDYDLIVAIDEQRYGDSGKKSDLCGKQVKITNTNNGKSVVATIADDCPSCKNSNSIDLSQGTFEHIATLDEGMVPISWTFV